MKMMRLVLAESDNNTLNIANADEVRFASFSDSDPVSGVTALFIW